MARPAALPAGTRECIGLEQVVCDEVLKGLATGSANGPAGPRTPVAWRIRCTDVCDRSRGETEITVTWSDGDTTTASHGWVGELVPGEPGAPGGPGAGPIPTPAVPPTCIRVPAKQCHEQWATSLVNLSPEQWPDIVSVEVACRETCTLLEGKGTTTIVLDDGTRVAGAEWGYDTRP